MIKVSIYYNETNFNQVETELLKTNVSSVFKVHIEEVKFVKNEMLPGTLVDIQIQAELLIPPPVDTPEQKKNKSL